MSRLYPAQVLGLAVVLFFAGCAAEEPEAPICTTLDVLSSEVMVFGDCADDIDNDGDGASDCMDEDCVDDPACAPENKPPGVPSVWIISSSGPGQPVPPELPVACVLLQPGLDPEGETVYHRFSWSVDGEPHEFEGSELPSKHTQGGQEWECRVTPFDGQNEGPSDAVSVLIASNNPPSSPVVEITPALPNVGQDLDCTILVPSVDPDGDHITYFFAWEKDEQEMSFEGSEIFAAETSAGETWTCIATATDGLLQSEPGVASVVIQ